MAEPNELPSEQLGFGGSSDRLTIPIALLDDLGQACSLDELMTTFAKWVPHLTGADQASIALVTDNGANVELVKLAGPTTAPVGTNVVLEGTLIGTAITEQRVVVVDDRSELRSIEATVWAVSGSQSAVSIPMLGAKRCLGAVNLAYSLPGYLSEERLGEATGLVRLITSHVAMHLGVTKQRRLAATDGLTGVLSRDAILSALRRVIDTSSNQSTAVLYIDLDGFKSINDTYGHAAGDQLLKETACRFVGTLRSGDAIGRLGGDEFLVVLEPGSDDDAALAAASRLHTVCTEPIDLGLYSVTARASIGAATTAGRLSNADDLLLQADLAMYQAKRSATPIVVADETISRRAGLIATVDRELEDALTNGDISYHYQPVRRLTDMVVLGAEALLRWNHPVQGYIPPLLIIERIETTGRLAQFTNWTLETAARDLRELRRQVPEYADKAIAINLTPAQLGWAGYVEAHVNALSRHGLRPVDLIVEVVESGLVEAGTSAEDNLRALADLPTTVALDDFGSGHNVLGYFAQFPVGAIKFDRHLIETAVTSARVRAIIRGLSQVASELDIHPVAEGIERREHIDLCLELGIEKGQGFLLGRPMPLESLVALFVHDSATAAHPASSPSTGTGPW